MDYILDSVGFLAYLADNLPPKIINILDNVGEKTRILLPSIVIGETLYTIYRGKEVFGSVIPRDKIDFIFQMLSYSEGVLLIDMDLESWRLFDEINIPELHDRMIVACAIRYGVEKIITTDSEIKEVFPTIWE